MEKLSYYAITIGFSMIAIGFILIGFGMAHGEVQKQICILQPINQGVNPMAVSKTVEVLIHHKINYRLIGLVEELTNKTHKGCDGIIQFGMMNDQRQYGYEVTNYQTKHYRVSGNVLTLYTTNIPVIPNTAFGGSISVPMENYACMLLALGSYHQNLGYTGSTYCNPFGNLHTSSMNVPIPVVEKCLIEGLKELGF